LVVAYWTLVLSFIAALAVASRSFGAEAAGRAFLWFWWALLVPPVLLRSVARWSTRSSILLSLNGIAEPNQGPHPMDERELSLHYRMHTKAFYLLQIFVPAGVLLLTPPEIHRSAWLASARIPLLWLLSMVVLSLPQSMILWTEPDMEEQ
jgi:hypothetical protein